MKRGAITAVGGVIAVALLVFAFLPGSSGRQNLQLSFTGLPSLGGGYNYEGWAVVDGGAWSTGKFDVLADGTLVDLDGIPVKDGVYGAGIDLSEATAVAITIHPPDDDRGPNAPHIVAGEVVELEADLTIATPHAFGTDFASAQGVYVISASELALNFRLPVLIDGWEYEAWVVDEAESVSLGRLGQDAGAMMAKGDEMMAKDNETSHEHEAASGGETRDHRLTAEVRVLRGKRLLLTVEPALDNSPAPFGIRVLEVRVAAATDDGVQYQLQAAELPLPAGHATVK
jgi:hypothetical protein